MSGSDPRDMVGYGQQAPHPKWPGGARVAVQFVVNYEEGGERCVLDGDEHSESFLTDIAGTRVTGSRPLGWYTGRTSPNTRRLVVEEGGFLYDSDSYADDLPYWVLDYGRPHLVIPYSLDTNDMRFAAHPGFSTGDEFFTYLRDAFDMLYDEGGTAPKMMSVGLHCRLSGRPGRARSLERFLDLAQSRGRVWLCRRIDIANHWHAQHRPVGA